MYGDYLGQRRSDKSHKRKFCIQCRKIRWSYLDGHNNWRCEVCKDLCITHNKKDRRTKTITEKHQKEVMMGLLTEKDIEYMTQTRSDSMPIYNRENLKRIEKQLEEAKKGTVCLADRVLNYILFLIKRFNMQDDMGFKSYCIDLYQNLRVEGCFTDSNPIAKASGLFYLTAVWFGKDVTQNQIAYAINLTGTTIRREYNKIRSQAIEHEIYRRPTNEELEYSIAKNEEMAKVA